MSGQVADNKFILDATAGFRMMWFDKNNIHTVYMDKRNDIEILNDIDQFGKNRGRPIFKDWTPTNPTVQGDFRKTDFPDKAFKLIVWDPPHLKGSGSRKHQQGLCFGVLQAETWQSDFKKGFSELWRILADYGVLFFKWHDSQFDYKTVLKLFAKKPLLGQTSSSHLTSNGKKRRHTFWFCFMKIPEEAKP
jgi:hypothetical protein